MSIRFNRMRNNLLLFSLNFFYIFVVGFFENSGDVHLFYPITLTGIYLAAFLAIRGSRNIFFSLPVLVIILNWISYFFNLNILRTISGVTAVLFFLYIIFYLVFRVAQSRQITRLEFLESVNIYLLLGISGAILFQLVNRINPGAFSSSNLHTSDFIYFSFVTMTTLGYGDISPVSPAARSLAIFYSVTGQLYLTMIIALLIGKYLTKKN